MLHLGPRFLRTVEIYGQPAALEPLTLPGRRPDLSSLAAGVLCVGIVAGTVALGSVVLRHGPATTARVADSRTSPAAPVITGAVVHDPRVVPNRRRRGGRRPRRHARRRPRRQRATPKPDKVRRARPISPVAPPAPPIAQPQAPSSPPPPPAPRAGGGVIDREFF